VACFAPFHARLEANAESGRNFGIHSSLSGHDWNLKFPHAIALPV
jgi:hypothetical protein